MMSPASLISLLVLASLLLGLARDMVVAYYFGADWPADLYFLALIIPLFFENSLAVSLRDALVPAFIRKHQEGPAPYQALVARIGGAVVLLSLALVLGFAMTANFWIGVLGGGQVSEGGDHIRVAYTLGIAMIPLLTWSYFLTSLCHTENRFVLPAWRGVMFNLGGLLVLGLVWRSTEGLLAGMLAGQLLHVMVVHWELRFFSLRAPAEETRLRKDLLGLMPQFLTLLAVALLLQLGISVERLLASWTGAGGLSRLSYAFRIVTVPLVVFGFAVLGIAYARFSRALAAGDPRALSEGLRDTLLLCLFLLLPASIAIHVFSGELLAMLLQRGAFTARDVEYTARVMDIYALGLPAMGLGLVLVRLLVAIKSFSRLLLATMIALSVMCASYFAVYRPYGIEGLAAVTAAGAWIHVFLLWLAVPQRLRGILGRPDWIALGASALLLLVVIPPLGGHGLPGMIGGGILCLALPYLVLVRLDTGIRGSMARLLGRQESREPGHDGS